MIVEDYGWYVMPSTLHKLLEHDYQVVEILDLPIGIYTEEAHESLNKEMRIARLSHACKVSQKNAMINQLHYLLLRSDPLISSSTVNKSKNYGGRALEEDVVAFCVRIDLISDNIGKKCFIVKKERLIKIHNKAKNLFQKFWSKTCQKTF